MKREMTSIRSAHLRQNLGAKRAGLQGLGTGDSREKETRWRHIRKQIDLFCKLIEYGSRRRGSAREDGMFYVH